MFHVDGNHLECIMLCSEAEVALGCLRTMGFLLVHVYRHVHTDKNKIGQAKSCKYK